MSMTCFAPCFQTHFHSATALVVWVHIVVIGTEEKPLAAMVTQYKVCLGEVAASLEQKVDKTRKVHLISLFFCRFLRLEKWNRQIARCTFIPLAQIPDLQYVMWSTHKPAFST